MIAKRTLAVAGIAAAFAVAVAATAISSVRRERAAEALRADAAFGVGRTNVPAPPVAVQLADGGSLSLAELRGQVVFVNFWATWCEPCREEMPSMLQLGRDLAAAYPNRFRMVAVSVDGPELDGDRVVKEPWDVVREFFGGRLPSEATVALDPDYAATRAYYCNGRGECSNNIKFPETYVIDASGRVVAYVVGPRDWTRPAARRFLERIIEG
jgi:thiol-disulfide isomerase/thioredoxin